jgi:hypothetical protein
MSDDQTYGGSSKVAATFHGPALDRVDTAALRAVLSRSWYAPEAMALCDEVDRLTETLDRVRAVHKNWSTESIYSASLWALYSELGAALDEAQP